MHRFLNMILGLNNVNFKNFPLHVINRFKHLTAILIIKQKVFSLSEDGAWENC